MTQANNQKSNKGNGCGCILLIIAIIVMIGTCGSESEKKNSYTPTYSYESTQTGYVSLPTIAPTTNENVIPPAEGVYGGTGEINGEKLMGDIHTYNRILDETGMGIESLEITNSSMEDGLMTVWVVYTAENSYCRYFGEILFAYDGQEVDYYEIGHDYYEPKFACDPNVPFNYVADVYVGAMPTVEIVSHEKTGEFREDFAIKVDFYEDPGEKLTDMHYVTCDFDLYSGWYVSDSRQERVN